ncbi:MAG TPA: YceI family protein [Terriglobales bacterium]|jgi:polyisoprenoid-binding protein YceI|nr:YceI family protein [Terriglobales bacterium]
MRKSVLSLFAGVALILPAAAQVQSWSIDPAHSAAQFSVRHMGISNVHGTFTKLSGKVDYDPADVSKTMIDATIEAASVDTRVEMRDNDLRSDHFFDAAKYPSITFKSKKVESAGTGKLKITGDLTIHGVTKEVVLDVDGPTEPAKDPKGNLHVGVSGSTKINRKDFGVNGAAAMVGDEVPITLDLELVHPAS